MTHQHEDELRPEDHWPEAERLLDTHFKRKRRRSLIIFFALLLLGTWGGYTLFQNGGGTLPKYDISAERNGVSAAENTSEASIENSEGTEESNTLGLKDVTPSTSEKNGSDSRKLDQSVSASGTQIVQGANKASIESTGNTIGPDRTTFYYKKAGQRREEKINTVPNHAVISLQLEEEKSLQHRFKDPGTNPNEPLTPLRSLLVLPATTHYDYPLQRTDKTFASAQQSRSALVVYAGMSQVSKKMESTLSADWLKRRKEEESALLLPYAGLQWSHTRGHLEWRAGLEFSMLGERTNYSPYADGDYTRSYQSWQPIQYTVTDTDSTYIFGILFYNTRNELVNDSVYTTTTDSLNGIHYDAEMVANNGINRWYILEVPVEVVYQVRKGRWSTGLSAGLSAGWVLQTRGTYINSEQEGFAPMKRENNMQLALQARAGIELGYALNERARILLRPAARYQLTGLSTAEKVRQRYRMLGVQAGVLLQLP